MPTRNDLQRFDCFHQHSEAALTAVAAVMRPRTLIAGEPLFRQGESDGSSCFLLCSGCVAVHRKDEQQMRKLAKATAAPQSISAEPPGSGPPPADDVLSADEGGLPLEIQNKDSHGGQPGGKKASRAEKLGGDRAYVGMYVQKKYVRVHEPEDHGELLFRRMPGAVLGVLSALTGCKRHETAVAEVDCTAFEVRREDYITWLATKEEKAHAGDCLFLRETPCFCRLPDSVLVKAAASFQRTSHPIKIDICSQGTTAVAMYVIRSGECELTRRVKKPSPEMGRAAERGHVHLHLANLGRTDLIGHHELLSNSSHNFSVSTISEVELWALSSETLHALLEGPSGHSSDDGVLKRLKRELIEHGQRTSAFHKQRAYQTWAARWDPQEQERLTEMSVKQEEQTPEWKAAEAARVRMRQEHERRGGKFCSAIEEGPALVGQVLKQKVYTRVVELKPRIHKLLRQPLETTARALPHILSKRQQMFQAPVKADLTSGVDSTPQWMEYMDFPEPFRRPESNLSKREQLIHDQLNYAVNMFDTYSSLAMKRLRRSAPKTSKTDARASTTRTAHTAHTARTARTATSTANSPTKSRVSTTRTAKSVRSCSPNSPIGATSALWIDLEGFLSVLEGAGLVVRSTVHKQRETVEREWEAAAADEKTGGRSPELSPPFEKAAAAAPSRRETCTKTQVDEEDAIRLFLTAARRLRNAPGSPDRCISFEHFLACLRRISATLHCPSPQRLQDAERAIWPATADESGRQHGYNSMAVHVDVPEGVESTWKSPLLLRESLMQRQRQQRTQPSMIGYAPEEIVRHHPVKLRRTLQPPTSHLPQRPWVPRVSAQAPSNSAPPPSPTRHADEPTPLSGSIFSVSRVTLSLDDELNVEKPGANSGFRQRGLEREILERSASRRPLLPTLARQPRSASAEPLSFVSFAVSPAGEDASFQRSHVAEEKI